MPGRVLRKSRQCAADDYGCDIRRGVAWRWRRTAQFNSPYVRGAIYAKAGMTAQTADIVVTFSGVAAEAFVAACSFNNVDQTTPVRPVRLREQR